MNDELQKLVETGRLTSEQAAALERLAAGAVVSHKSWGVGRVKELDAVFGRLIVDFPNKTGHSFDLAFAAESLTLLPPEHIAARAITDLATLQALARENPLELLRCALASHGGAATAEEIAAALAGRAIPEAEWKGWWEKTKRAARKDGHFSVPAKKNEPIRLRATPLSHADELLEAFRAKHGLKEKVRLAEQWLEEQSSYNPQNPAAQEMAAAIVELLERLPPRQAATALEAVWLLLRLGSACAVSPEALRARERSAMGGAPLARLAEELPAGKFGHLLAAVRLTQEEWAEALLRLASESASRQIGEIMDFLIQQNQAERAQAFLAQAVRDLTAGSELLLWLAKNRAVEKYRAWIAPLLGPRFLASALATIEQDALDAPRRSRHGLREFLLEDEALFGDLLADVPEDEARQIAERVWRSSVIDEQSKRSLMARFIKLYPALQTVVLTASPARGVAEPLYVSAESLTRKQAEYDDLVNRQIPENARQIAIARGYGDLSENHEFKSAKEQQALLNRRKAEMERELASARVVSFDAASAESVAIGTRVTIHDEAGGEVREYAVLGAWDSDPSRGVISYLSPIARALMNKRVGDEAEVEVEGARHRVKIVRIAPFRALNVQPASATA